MKSTPTRARLPRTILYCTWWHLHSTTHNKISSLKHVRRKTCFYNQILLSHGLSSLSHSWKLGLPKCLPDVSQMSLECLPDVCQMSLRCLPDVSQISPRCLPDVSQMSSQMSPRCLPDSSSLISISWWFSMLIETKTVWGLTLGSFVLRSYFPNIQNNFVSRVVKQNSCR